ncbi:hypothetical protein ACJMK2_037859 [Sinanodonta woodiana]|uniref:EF-hand domain-containing protein n=1 Tax=Sinanodonta woodiana TaxID=1069815 RepID=A0ABD3WLR2_SINWO
MTYLGFCFGADGYSFLPRKLTKEDEILLSRIFDTADEDGKGYLSREDLKVALVELFGYKPTKMETNQLLEKYGDKYDSSNCKVLSKEQFMASMMEKMVKRDEDEEIRQTFLAFDMQCHGFLTVEDLKKVFSQVAPSLPAQSIHSSFRELDRDGDGRISYKDFNFMMKYNAADHI